MSYGVNELLQDEWSQDMEGGAKANTSPWRLMWPMAEKGDRVKRGSILLLSAWHPWNQLQLLAHSTQTSKRGEGLLEVVAPHEGHFMEEEDPLRKQGASAIKEYKGRKKWKPEWTQVIQKLRRQTCAGSFEGLIQLNKRWIFPVFARFLQSNISGSELFTLCLGIFYNPRNTPQNYLLTGSYYLHYDERISTLHHIFASR